LVRLFVSSSRTLSSSAAFSVLSFPFLYQYSRSSENKGFVIIVIGEIALVKIQGCLLLICLQHSLEQAARP
jgi:hypothetical protein